MSAQATLANFPGMSPFVPPEVGAKAKNEFYELKEKVTEVVNTFNRVKAVDPARAAAYRKENIELFRVSQQVNRINKELAELRKRERLIREAPNSRIKPEEKEVRINRLREQEQRALQKIGQLRLAAGL